MSDVFTDDDLANAEDRMRQSASNVKEGLREDEIMRLLSSDNPRARRHREERADGWSSWGCVPIKDVIEVRSAALAHAAPEGLDAERVKHEIAETFRILRRYEHGNMVDSVEAERSILARLARLSQPDASASVESGSLPKA